MRLTTRLNLFFLGALALVLAGFSASLFGLASTYLRRQVDERLDGALNTLTAAAEQNEHGVEWEPEERTLTFGRRAVEGSFAWRVADDSGTPIDGSTNARVLPARAGIALGRARSHGDGNGTTWRIAERRIEAPDGARNTPPGPGWHNALVLTVGVSLHGVHETLRTLALMLLGLSAGVWTLALVGGRWFCRRALRPVAEMAESAHDIGGDEPGRRLPMPAADDELGELGRAFNALLDRLQVSFERQRRFTGDASHQLRTPLTAMQGQIDVVLRQERAPEEYRRVLGLVQRRTRHLRQIVESLLFLARADAEATRPSLEPIELSAWIDEHLRAWHEPKRAGDVQLIVDPDAGPLRVMAQTPLLGELVNNLLDNAARYSEPGTPIVVRLSADSAHVALSVQDHGVGIPRDELTCLFSPFFRSETARSRNAAGLGLGLSVAQRLAQLFGGSLAVESTPGQGSTFTLRLPAAPLPCPEPDSAVV